MLAASRGPVGVEPPGVVTERPMFATSEPASNPSGIVETIPHRLSGEPIMFGVDAYSGGGAAETDGSNKPSVPSRTKTFT